MIACGHFFKVRGSCTLCYEINYVGSFMTGYSTPVLGRFSIFLFGTAVVALLNLRLLFMPLFGGLLLLFTPLTSTELLR